jgi:gag-polypeptide of LTR copia-type
MSGNVDNSIQIPIPMLKKSDYATWRTEILETLEELDPEFLNRLKENPTELKQEEFFRIKNWYWTNHEKTKSVDMFSQNQKWLRRENLKWIKDAQVRNILLNGLDAAMLKKVSGSPTAKEVWDSLEALCQESDMIKKCKRICLIQEYEHFMTNQNETLNEAYDRFVTLLRNLALLGKTYANEDTNLKFLWSLPEKWYLITTVVQEFSDLEEISLDELYTKLRMCNLVRSLERRTRSYGKIKKHRDNLSYSDHSSSDTEGIEVNSDRKGSESELESNFSLIKNKCKKKKSGVRMGKVKCIKMRHLVKDCRIKNKGKGLITKDKELTQQSAFGHVNARADSAQANQPGSVNLTLQIHDNSAAKIDIVKKKGSKNTWILTLSN